MPYKDHVVSREKAIERKRRHRQKRHSEKYGPGAGDQRGKHGERRASSRYHRWSEGKILSSGGYTKLRVGKSHPLANGNGYAYEHLVVWVSAGNQRPLPGFLLHHKNEVKTDNRLQNLELISRSQHNALHLRSKPRRDPESGRFGKKAAGRELDGVIHDGYPTKLN